ncbi:hypothetical protein SNEBB_002939, partial [Seison nebaliae]
MSDSVTNSTSNYTVGDILRSGIQTVANNIPYTSAFGVCGDYHLSKIYSKYHSFPNKPNENLLQKCERLIRKTKEISSRDYERWNVILSDVFDLNENQQKRRDGYDYSFIYYSEIDMLNLEFVIGKIPGNQFAIAKPFLKNYQEIVGYEVMKDLNEDLLFLIKCPDVIQMSITDSPNFDLHPITIDDIATGLIN